MNEVNLDYFPSIGVRMGVFADDIVTGYPHEKANDYIAMKAEFAR